MKQYKLLKETFDNRVYRIVTMKMNYTYCYICQKRAGSFYAACVPNKVYGLHGNHKRIYSKNYRAYRSWKNTRKTQYK